MAGLLALWRALTPQQKGIEGQYRPGPYFLSGGMLSASAGRYWNWWQNGHSLTPYGERSAMVEACVSAYSQTVAMCPGSHWRKLDNGGREEVLNSDLSRILRRPNDYQSISDLMLNLTRHLYAYGEAFAIVIRNNRSEISELHQMRNGAGQVAADGSIFYDLSGNEIVESRYDLTAPVPARDVLHIRLHTPKHPLKGVSPILAATLDLAMTGAVLDQQITYYLNQARPSFMLETDLEIKEDQVERLRTKWKEQTTGENAGSSVILTHGLKAKPVTTTARDGQLSEMRKLNDANIALAFRIPLQILGVGGTPFASTEALMNMWISQGLGFCLNHIEVAFDALFRLQGLPGEYTEFSTDALLRSAYKEKIDGLVSGVMGGVISSDEARAVLELPKTPGGHGKEPRVQQQVVPLSYGTEMKPPDPNAARPAAAEPKPSPEDDPEQTKRMLQYFRTELDAHGRNAA